MVEDRLRKETLRCELTDDEVADRAQDLATLTVELDAAESEKAAVSKRLGARVAELREKLNGKARIVRERAEWRDVDVRDVPDYERGVMESIRLDTGVRVRVRALTPEERQLRIDRPADLPA